MKEIKVRAKNGKYSVLIGKGLIEKAGELTKFPRVAIVTEENVAPLYLEKLRSSLESAGVKVFEKVLPAGEQTKRMESLTELYEFLLSCHIKREDAVAALGGGVIGDLAGFAAATYMRGVGFIQIPTTLLAQVDSSVGGKVAIDFASGKNMIGSFYQPSVVIADTAALDTLPERQYKAGMAEVVKYAAIADESLVKTIRSGDTEGMIARCVEIKARIVEEDPLDKGMRALLNFGHTAGHAIESLSNFELLHGEAVAIGMSIMTCVGENMGLTSGGTASEINELLHEQGLSTYCDFRAEDIVARMSLDKKSEEGGIKIVLLNRLGSSFTRLSTAEELLRYAARAIAAQG